MKTKRWLPLGVLILEAWCALSSTGLAQSSKTPTASASAGLSEQEIRGEGLFLQHCSLCHLPKVVKPYKSFGPSLTGVLKGPNAGKERAIRLFISVGVPDKMPGFQYAFKPNELDDLMAYLKTL